MQNLQLRRFKALGHLYQKLNRKTKHHEFKCKMGLRRLNSSK
jgi:hypothetical protein